MQKTAQSGNFWNPSTLRIAVTDADEGIARADEEATLDGGAVGYQDLDGHRQVFYDSLLG
jgi:hypothetical protein